MSIYRGAGGSGDAVNDASSEATLVAQLVVEAQADADAAQASATAAAGSASTASTAATNASNSATSAATSATNASNSASSASTSATNAASSASTATTKASEASTSATNAATSASAASTSATNAAASATTATTQATNASNSATAAATSATNASNSATAASTSASNASTSATNAASSASAASTSASNAATSETNAAGSASSASTSASTATTQAGIATTKAGEAATSATNASNSASAASTSATNASNSATAAAGSATTASSAADAALAALDSFDDRYLGQKSTAPTVDNDGNALLAGALYFNTTTNEMKVYDGSAWLNAYASLSGALLATNNLSDLNNTATARTNLGVAIGTNVQAWDADLAAIAALSPTADNFIVGNGTTWTLETPSQTRTSLGATTVGSNLLTLTNPSAVTFPRLNADNTVSALDAATFRTAIGAGTGNGTVTSVTGTSPVASSGGTTPAISLSANYGDTLNPYASKTANFILAAPNGTAGVPSFRAVVAADIPTLNQNTTGTASNVTGTVAIANGGTGTTTRQNAMDALAGAVTSGQYLRGNGTDVVMSAIQAADVPTLNQNTTGTASNVTGTVAIANGGTGQTTKAPAFNALSPITTTGDLIIGNGSNSSVRLAIGTNGQVLTSNGTTATWAAAGGGFPSGTLMLFQQTSAPTGWTKQTTHDNKALRVVSGTASTGGSVAFTTAFASGLSAGATTLSTTQMPSHTHVASNGTMEVSGYGTGMGGWGITGSGYNSVTGSTGGGGSHTHTIPSFAVAYVDLIIASKD